MSDEKPNNIRVLRTGRRSVREILQEILDKEVDDMDEFIIISKNLDGDSFFFSTTGCMDFYSRARTVLDRMVMDCIGVVFEE